MKQMKTKIMSIIMAILMVIGMMPALGQMAYAEEDDRTEPLITVEMGAGHEEAAKIFTEYLNDAENGFTDCEAKVNGTKVTFYYTRSIIENHFEYDSNKDELTARTAYAQSAIDEIRWNALPDSPNEYYNYIENGEMLLNLFARNPIDDYMNGNDDEIEEEGDWETDATLLPMTQTFYAQWLKPIDECSITVEPPVCGEENSGDFYKNTNPPKVTINGEHYKISAGDDYYSAYWLKKGADGSYENEIFEGTFEGGEVYGAEIVLTPEYGYYFPKNTKVSVEGADLQAADELRPAASGQPNPSISGNAIGIDLNVTAEHSAGIELDTDHIEWTAEEGYKGATDDGIESDAVHQMIKATSTGNDEVEFVVAGFKDTKSYEQFTVSAGGMNVTVAPLEGLAPGIYTAVVVIGDFDDRFEEIEVPVKFTVTAKEEKAEGTNNSKKEDEGTKSSPETGDESNMILWMAVLIASCIALLTTIAVHRKKKED